MNSTQAIPNVDKAIPILDVSDYAASMDYYQRQLGFTKNWDYDGFGSVSRDQVEIFLSHNPEGKFGTSMTIIVRDAESLYTEFSKNDAFIVMAPQKMEWGVIELRVKDPDGHTIRFTQVLPHEEMVIERTTVEARIEKRLAAVMEDLAKETGRNVGELIEEVMLHSFEPIQGQAGHAVASPHTAETFRLIEQLKQKHSLDYDTHANYGFVEEENNKEEP